MSAHLTCPSCGASVPKGHDFCGQCGGSMKALNSARKTAPFSALMAPGRAKLIVIHGPKGALPGVSFHLNATQHTAGRSDAKVLLGADTTVSPLHANFFYRDDVLHVKDEGSLNGTFLRIRGPHALQHGDRFRVGGQIYQFEKVDSVPDFPTVRGTMMHVSPPKPFTFRIVQLLQGGHVGSIVSSVQGPLTFGSDGCDFSTPSDDTLSARHAQVTFEGGQYILQDLGSTNGTYAEVKADTPLQHNDYVFLGRHLVRVEVTA